jgi:NAD+ synthase
MLPSEYTSQRVADDTAAANTPGCTYDTVNIAGPRAATDGGDALAPLFDGLPEDLTEKISVRIKCCC